MYPFPISRRGEKHNRLSLSLRVSNSTNGGGLITWSNHGSTLQGDFLALAVNPDGRIEVRINLGKQQRRPLVVTSKVQHGIIATRTVLVHK